MTGVKPLLPRLWLRALALAVLALLCFRLVVFQGAGFENDEHLKRARSRFEEAARPRKQRTEACRPRACSWTTSAADGRTRPATRGRSMICCDLVFPKSLCKAPGTAWSIG